MPFDLPDNLRTSLLSAGVAADCLDAALRKSASDGDFGVHLEAAGGLTQQQWAELLADELGLDYQASLDVMAIDAAVLGEVTMQYCRRNRVLPLAEADSLLRVATADPLRQSALDDLRVLYGRNVDPVVVPTPVLTDAIHRAFDQATDMASGLMDGLEGDGTLELDAQELSGAPDLLEADDEAPIIRLVNSLIFQAAKDGASDVHVEPFERTTSVRFRVDGILREVLTPPARLHPALVSRIKVMASMNIAEKRLPQDGGIRTRVAGREIDVRVSTVPTSFGERVVMRLLDRSSTLLGLVELGVSDTTLDKLRRLIRQSHGIVLVTGPTGSGKTTTLYAALSEINSVDRNIITIEDPVEYQLRGVGQIQVNPKIDLTFASGLRSILRQDPDVIMVGEIRDSETARIAIQAALTGHLVFSTLHTNDSFTAITRLLDMGIEPFLVSSSVIGIVAQRLVRTLCPICSTQQEGLDPALSELGLRRDQASGVRVQGEGCKDCRGTGYKGRRALSELLVVDDHVRGHIMAETDAANIRADCVRRGMGTIRTDGASAVAAGKTTVAEVLRVTTEDID